MTDSSKKRQRLHELVIALIQQQDDLELMDGEAPSLDSLKSSSQNMDPASWLDRNKRVLSKYQSLILSAITLDALMDAEHREEISNA